MEASVKFVRFHHMPMGVGCREVVGLRQGIDAAQEGVARLDVLAKHGGEHARRGGFAVGACHRQRRSSLGNGAQHGGAFHQGVSTPFECLQQPQLPRHRRRPHHRHLRRGKRHHPIGQGIQVVVMDDGHPFAFEGLGQGASGEVIPCNHMPHLAKVSGDGAHADPANAKQKMVAFGVGNHARAINDSI